jgi:23S rRNA (guanine745-N1)-methyltransferase
VNLLQPQDRRAATPGDSAHVVAARRRFLEAGHAGHLLEALIDVISDAALRGGAAVLDVGCGEGYFLGSIQQRLGLVAHGVDISVAAVDAAAKRWPDASWIVANADRGLPFADESFDIVLSITGRRPAAEMRRVLRPDGALVVAVPAGDDLLELRQAVLGRGVIDERFEAVVLALATDFEPCSRRTVRLVAHLDAQGIADALAMTYRGARRRESERAQDLTDLDVTLAHDVGRFRVRHASLREQGEGVDALAPGTDR